MFGGDYEQQTQFRTTKATAVAVAASPAIRGDGRAQSAGSMGNVGGVEGMMKLLIGIIVTTALIIAIGSGGVYDDMEVRYGTTWTSQAQHVSPEEADAAMMMLAGVIAFFFFLGPIISLFSKGEYTGEYGETTNVGRGPGAGLAILAILAVLLGAVVLSGG